MLEVKLKRKLPGFNLDVDFTVRQDIMAFLGPSGSGKTMTLQCIAGLLHPDSGYVKLNNKVLFDSSSKLNLSPQMRRVGFVFQNYALFPHLTVNENIAYGIRSLPKSEIQARTARLLNTMNIPELGNRYPGQLSGGQQQRVAFARALAPEPELLLLDEPFSALDTQVKERLQLELFNIQNYYKGNILLVTHNLAEGYKLASQIAIYESGRIIQCDKKEKVISSPVNHTVARLTGVRNLFKGTVTAIEETQVYVMVPELDGRFRIELKEKNYLTLDQSVTVGIRPEYVHLSEYAVENTVTSVVHRMIEGVSSVEGFFYLKSKLDSRHWIEAILSRSDAERVSVGSECYLHFHPEHLIILND